MSAQDHAVAAPTALSVTETRNWPLVLTTRFEDAMREASAAALEERDRLALLLLAERAFTEHLAQYRSGCTPEGTVLCIRGLDLAGDIGARVAEAEPIIRRLRIELAREGKWQEP